MPTDDQNDTIEIQVTLSEEPVKVENLTDADPVPYHIPKGWLPVPVGEAVQKNDYLPSINEWAGGAIGCYINKIDAGKCYRHPDRFPFPTAKHLAAAQSMAELAAAALPKTSDEPAEATASREDWLRMALSHIHGKAYTMPVSYGFGKGGTRSAKGFSVHNDSKDQPQLFIHPTTRDPEVIIARLICATAQADYEHMLPCSHIAAKLPPFPTDGLPPSTTENKDGIRQIKCTCPACGFTFRTSAKWIAKGLPTCACGTKTIIAV